MADEELDRVGAWAPTACTLPTAAQPLREAEFDELFASAARGVERPELGVLRVDLDPSEPVAARAAGLVTRETSCCSFFTFTLTATGGQLRLEVSVPPAHQDVLDGLAARATALVGVRS